MSQSTTLLFGLPGVRVQRVQVGEFGARIVHVITAAEVLPGCPECGVVSTSVKGHASITPRDIPYGEREIAVIWHKRRWRCRESACERATFTESIPEVPPRQRTTGRLRRGIAAAVADSARSVSEVASAFGVTWPTANTAVTEAGNVELGEPEPTAVLGIDETRRGRPRWTQDPVSTRWVRTDAWDTGFVDLAGEQGLLGQIEGRTSACVVEWLNERTPAFRAAIAFVAIDPAAVYAKAITTPGLLPNAVLVVDHFHIVAPANAAVTKVRRRVIWEQHGRRGRKLDPAWANRRRLLTARERLSEKAFAAMWNSVIDSEPSGQVISAWIAKEQLRGVLALARTGADRSQIYAKLYGFYRWCARAEIEELATLATTIETWCPAIAEFIDTGITNARTEGINRLIKQVKRSACGFRNVENSHRRIRLHATRKHRAATAASRALPAQL
ncbi:ISL3 family transposase [Sporichthya sp.]|uniref:ISL3 family transposase n=1 Tax=Sporichthya sp. TaxID=65475 RepID=UPI00185B93BE|nr:ISL3 family transposase [Sporichthya sp.]MBA3741943.1 ISL3 family transposase [Sporichthya sp.]